MNMMTAIGAMLAQTTSLWGIPKARSQAPPKPRYGSVKRYQRAAAKARARRRAKRLKKH
ncbi:hypothetical protein DFO67_108187 [Modicisalibacter xianhensis]|uniref:Uncharacterized protein n=1 Tax=Modicisalibacter xianhensis TaxID=442341 RepID=A0A4R8FY05_9GAMM|nr:hypothetical protein [Halomonas xianhensis]TDX29143.1 hypothetical protein DFO67_108187 [Halomonas xianhensis]